MTPERLAEIRANRANERYSCGQQGCYGHPAEEDVDDLLAHVDTLTAERDALTQRLACERGDSWPEGWTYFPFDEWRRPHRDRQHYRVVRCPHESRMMWGLQRPHDTNPRAGWEWYDTALEAMNAAMRAAAPEVPRAD